MFSVLLIPLLVDMSLGVNMGGSGSAPLFSVAYSANLSKLDLIPVLFGVRVLIRAIVAGEEVTKTIGKGILSESFSNNNCRSRLWHSESHIWPRVLETTGNKIMDLDSLDA